MKNIFKKRKEREQRNKIIEILKYVVPVILAILIFIVIKFGIMNRDYELKKIDLVKYTSLVNSNKKSLIYITTSECDTCSSTEELLKKVLKGSSIRTYEVNISELSDEDLSAFMDMFDETRDGVVTPSLMLVENGKVVSSLMWPFEEDGFITYLQDNSLVKE